MRKFLSAKRPTVTVFTDFSRPGGRDLFAGILRQMRTRSDWNVRIVQSLAEMTSDRIRAEESDGVGGFIVSELIDEGFRRAIERSRVPTVVVGNYRNPLPRRTHSISFVHVDDDDLICDSTDPTLSSISLDTEAEGLAAAGELARLMRSPKGMGRHLSVPAKLQVIERSSTLRTVPALHLVRRAQEFISRNAGRRIRVQDVVDDLHVSRRLAETRFRQYCGTSLNAAIVEARLAHFAKKLKTHLGSVSALARACGFDDPKYLARIFRKRFGKTPREFRDREE